MLRGRDDERAVLDGLLDVVRAGAGRALAIQGEPGIGKSALLQSAAERAADMRVLRAVAVEAESELAFAFLHQLLRPVLDLLDALPEPQRRALLTAFGLTAAKLRRPLAHERSRSRAEGGSVVSEQITVRQVSYLHKWRKQRAL